MEFLAEVEPERRAECEAAPGLAASLEELVRAGQEAWPQLAAAPAAVVRQVARTLAREVDPEAGVRGLVAGDLHLAAAAVAGIEAAERSVEELCRLEAGRSARQVGVSPVVEEEAAQVVREIVLVAHGDRPASLARYSGRGGLRAWIRVIALREVIRVNQHGRREQHYSDDALSNVLLETKDPERKEIAASAREPFRLAFGEAMKSLTRRQRLLLRHQYLDGLTTAQVGSLYQVHASTISRWTMQAREELLERTRGELVGKLGIDAAEADSVIRSAQESLELSLERLLALSGERDLEPED